MMLVSFHREKLLNAIVYFIENTKHCHTLKLFKLLNFLDFEHYRQTGKSVTELDYMAFPKGPVPARFWEEIRNPSDELKEFISINEIKDDLSGNMELRDIKARKEFCPDYFSKRELEIMERLTFFFDEYKANDMSEFSHEPKLPWRKVFNKGKGRGEVIPYDLALTGKAMVNTRDTIDTQELEYFRETIKNN